MQYTETKGGIVVPLEVKQKPNFPPEILPDWTPYYGSNHKRLPDIQGMKFGGGITYKSHLGKPLNDRLWQDILYRMNVTSLWIIKDGQSEWCLGRGPGSMTIYLDENDLVEDIYYVP